jgi:hypothetical protein
VAQARDEGDLVDRMWQDEKFGRAEDAERVGRYAGERLRVGADVCRSEALAQPVDGRVDQSDGAPALTPGSDSTNRRIRFAPSSS